MPEKILYFVVQELIYFLFWNNNLVWKLQLCQTSNLSSISIVLINIVFLLDEMFYFFCKPRGSLLSIVNVQSEIKLERIFKIVQNSVPIKHINCSPDKISICIFVVLDFAKIRRIKNFQVTFCKNNLEMKIRM